MEGEREREPHSRSLNWEAIFNISQSEKKSVRPPKILCVFFFPSSPSVTSRFLRSLSVVVCLSKEIFSFKRVSFFSWKSHFHILLKEKSSSLLGVFCFESQVIQNRDPGSLFNLFSFSKQPEGSVFESLRLVFGSWFEHRKLFVLKISTCSVVLTLETVT